jgi:MFS family permease
VSGLAQTTPPSGRAEVRLQWPLLAAAAVGVMVSFASVFIYSFGVLLKPLASEFGWSRGQVSAGFSIAALTVAAASPIIGRVADRIGVRAVILVCSSVFGLAFASLATLGGSVWQFYATMFVIGCVGNGATQLTWGRMVAARFDSQRGLALAIMMVGGGIGSLLVPPLAMYLAQEYGWRWAYAGLGAAVLAIGPTMALAVLPVEARLPVLANHSVRVASPFRNPVFRALLAAFFLVSVGANGCVAHLAPMLTDRGAASTAAAWAVAVLGLSSVTGRLVTGFLIDRYFAPRVAFCIVAASAGGLLLISTTTNVVVATAAVALIGFAMGAEADVFPYLISRYMGLSSFAELYGYAFSAYAVGGALGPLLMGVIYDQTHSYGLPLVLGAATTAAAAALLLKLPLFQGSRVLAARAS